MSAPAIVGVDVGGTSVRAARVEGGAVVARAARPVPAAAAADVVLAAVLDTAAEVVDGSVAGVGCGVPSVVDVERGIVYDVEHIPAWREVHLKDAFEARFRRPAAINNDANAFAVGELHFGAGRGVRHMVGVTLGTGVGSGVVINGSLYSGAHCGAGEIGAMPYRDTTLEQHCASHFFTRAAGVGGDVAFARAERGDAEALRLLHAYGGEVGHALMIVLYAFDPELIVLGGSIARAFRHFEAGMRERLADFAYQHVLARVRIVPSALADAALLGAAALFLDAQGAREGR